jgi:hypothetical protein
MTIAAAIMAESDGFGGRTLLMIVAFALLYLGFYMAAMGAGNLVDFLRVTLSSKAQANAQAKKRAVQLLHQLCGLLPSTGVPGGRQPNMAES